MNETVTPTKDEITFGLLSHLSQLAGFVVPFGGIVAPLVIWQVKKEQSAYVAEHAKEALNFQISIALYSLICLPLICVFIGFILLGVLMLFEIVMIVIASMKANEGVLYRYPLCIRFVK